ncbi:MAG: hypothetical protein HQK49_18415 [Oligoflexia bacterium]|nr:hypothetical protein [Oligoflexia bacterium]
MSAIRFISILFVFSILSFSQTIFAKIISLDQWSLGPGQINIYSNNVLDDKIYSKSFFAFNLFLNDIDIQQNDSDFNINFNINININLANNINNNSLAFTTDIGKPKLPVIVKMVEIFSSDASDLKITINKTPDNIYDLIYYFQNQKITPLQLPIPKIPGAENNIIWMMDKKHYTSDAFYPQSDFEIKNIIQIREKKFAIIAFYPIKYNPQKNQLLISKNFNAIFQLKNTPLNNNISESETSTKFDTLFSRSIMNYHIANISNNILLPNSHNDSILIITDDKFLNFESFIKYVTLQRERGFNVIVQTMQSPLITEKSDVGLRRYIQSVYANSTPKLSYVILIGDSDFIPTHQSKPKAQSTAYSNLPPKANTTHVTDHFYRAIDSDNYESDIGGPDLMLGRIAIKNENELNIVLNKIIKYEKKQFSDFSWIKNISFISTSDFWWYQVPVDTHNYVIQNFTAPKNYIGRYPTQNELGGDKLYYYATGARTDHLLQMFQQGRSIIIYSGHGSNTYWAGPSFTQANVQSLNHSDALPLVVGHACITNTFAESYDSFAETWLKHPKGAISYWGASNNTTWYEDDILEKKFFEGILGNNSNEVVSLGEITHYALIEFWKHYQGQGSSKYYMEIYNLTGDVAVDLHLD